MSEGARIDEISELKYKWINLRKIPEVKNTSSNQFSKLSKSSKSSEYGTPIELYQKLNKIFNFGLDPCTTEDNPLGTGIYFTKEHDGLSYPWNRNVFCNPPFGKGVSEWIKKMNKESSDYNREYVYVMLLPAKMDTKWMQDLIMNQMDDIHSCIYFLKGRLKFINPTLNAKSEPHIIGSLLWIRNASESQKKDLRYDVNGTMVYEWVRSGKWSPK